MNFKDQLKPFEPYLPYMVMVVGIAAALLFIWYFAAETDDKKRKVGTALAIILSAFSLFCIGLGLKLGIDLQGGASFLVRVQPAEGRALTPDALRSAQEIIEKRLNPHGGKDVTITPQGADGLYVEVPGLSDEEIRESRGIIERVAKLELRLLSPDNQRPRGDNTDSGKPAYYATPNPLGAETGIKPGYTLMPYKDRDDDAGKDAAAKVPQTVYVKNRAEMSGKSVKSASPALQPGHLNYEIMVTLTSEGASQMKKLSTENEGRPMAIVLDNVVLSAPTINSVLGDRFSITGNFTEKGAKDLASAMENPLENPLKVEQASTTSATYGKEVIQQGLNSVYWGLAATLLFMLIYYRLSGIIAVIGLVVNLLLLLGLMQIFGFTLTLPGIAGIILTLGMAVDANVLIYERMREEFAHGKSLSAAINAAYDRAFSAIFDGHVTTLLTAALMMMIATGAIYGFGLSLTIGLLASLFSSLLITRVCFLWLVKLGLDKLTFLHLINNKLYDFMGKRKICFAISGIVSLLCIGAVVMKGSRSLGYELRGGDAINLPVIKGLTEAKINQSLADFATTNNEEKFDASTISVQSRQPLGGEPFFTIRSGPGTSEAVISELRKDLSGEYPDIAKTMDVQTMGSAVGRKMLINSVLAVVAGLVGIFIYLSFRFEFAFAVGAIVALIHDVTVAVGVCVISGREIGMILIGAFLTIAGFSVNDTIVIFDRVRENLRTQKGDLTDILNHSISATLSRTIITTLVTSLSVVSMFIFGGKSMSDFSFTMLVGMLTGIYSTIFIASPTVLWWATRRKLNLRKQILDADALRLEALSTMEREAPEKQAKPVKGVNPGTAPS
ncbi:MAG: protein translocase subunit SecD [Verrucomicrobiaceae bacterium]|nr:MAG: protein translocase subunit SecD [Verrucomicrobiaceae bacterium]